MSSRVSLGYASRRSASVAPSASLRRSSSTVIRVPRITGFPSITFGSMLKKPVIRGTRITVELLLRKLAEGATEADLLDAYPRLTREDIHAAIGYAADTLAHEETIIVTPKT